MAAVPMRESHSSPDEVDVTPDPDTLKMPESGLHSQAVDLLVLATRHLLGDDVWVFRDLNWYPTDGGNAIAPDVMVLPRAALDEPPKSYRQDRLDGPRPVAVIEVVSDTDTFAGMLAKCGRYRRLQTPAYVIVVDDEPTAFRVGPDDPELIAWVGRPLDEFGGFTVTFPDGEAVVTMPGGAAAATNADLAKALAEQEAQAAEQRARAADQQVAELRARLEALESDKT